MTTRQLYPTDLTGPQWAQVSRFIPAPKANGRPPKYERREIVNALLYIARTGCQWRAMPHDLPPWRIVYWYFMAWKKDGTLVRLHDELRGDLRQAEGRLRQPSAAVLDSQSVKTTEKGGLAVLTQGRRSPAASGTSWSTRSA
jgi:putative transposase